MDIISRKEAKEKGLRYYFTGKPCPQKHISKRFVSAGTCASCAYEKERLWRNKNPEKTKAMLKKYRESEKGKTIRSCLQSKRKAIKNKRIPNWVSNDDLFLIEETYSLAGLRTKLTGKEWHVDHIVPLQGKNVSGFHCIENLQVIIATENQKKYNSWNWDQQK
jgi:hypothetical protein